MCSAADQRSAKNETPKTGVSATLPTNVSWLEVSLLVDGEMAEVVAEVLARFAPGGVVIESTTIQDDPDGEGHATGPVRVYAYLINDDNLDQKRAELLQALWYLGKIHQPLPSPEFTQIKQNDWTSVWIKNYRPVSIGRRLTVVPAWMEAPKGDRIPIFIDPGMAFGSGTHPSTQLCLEILDDLLSNHGNTGDLNVIDIGCGSGILSIAAVRLGAGYALGVDSDKQAVQAARENADVNGVVDRTTFSLGSVAAILDGSFAIQRASIVMANLLAPTILKLFNHGLADLITQDGCIVLSGILGDQISSINEAVDSHGLRMSEKRGLGDWVAVIARL